MNVSGKLLQGSGYVRKLLESAAASGPAEGDDGGPRVRNANEAAFDSNLVIILAALLCALICALGLNSLVRCALRCSRRLVFESADDVAIRLANTGLKKKAMKALPTIVYSSASRFLEPGADCPICLAEFVEGEKVRVLPRCNHSFHVDCIDTWLQAHSSCPTCRHCLLGIVCELKPGVAAALPCDPPTESGPSRAAASDRVEVSSEGPSPSPVAEDTSAVSSPVPEDTSAVPSSDSSAVADLEAGENPRPSDVPPCN